MKNFASDSSEPRDQNRENNDSRAVKNATLEAPKSRCNKTDKNNTDLSETDPFLSGAAAGMESEGKDNRTMYQEYFSQQLGLASLMATHPDDEDMLREMLELLADTVCSKRRFIRIAGDDKPANDGYK